MRRRRASEDHVARRDLHRRAELVLFVGLDPSPTILEIPHGPGAHRRETVVADSPDVLEAFHPTRGPRDLGSGLDRDGEAALGWITIGRADELPLELALDGHLPDDVSFGTVEVELVADWSDEVDSDRRAALLEIEELPRPVALGGPRARLEGEAEAIFRIPGRDLPYADDAAVDERLDLGDPASGVG